MSAALLGLVLKLLLIWSSQTFARQVVSAVMLAFPLILGARVGIMGILALVVIIVAISIQTTLLVTRLLAAIVTALPSRCRALRRVPHLSFRRPQDRRPPMMHLSMAVAS